MKITYDNTKKTYTSVKEMKKDLAELQAQVSQIANVDLLIAENKARSEFETHMAAAADFNLQTLRNVLGFLSHSWDTPRPASDLFSVMMKQPVFIDPAAYASDKSNSLCVFSLFDPFADRKVNHFSHFSLRAFSRDLGKNEAVSGSHLPSGLVEVGYFDFKAHRFILFDDADQRAQTPLEDLSVRLNAHYHLTGVDAMHIALLTREQLFSIFRLLRALPLHESEHAFAEQVTIGLGDWLKAHKHGNEADGIDGYVLGTYGYNASTHSNAGVLMFLRLYLLLMWASMACGKSNPTATYESALSTAAFANKLKNAQYDLFVKSHENRKSPENLKSLNREIAALEKLLSLFPESGNISKLVFKDTRKKQSFGKIFKVVLMKYKNMADHVERVEMWIELAPTDERGIPSRYENKKSHPAELFFDKTIIAM